MNLGFTQLHQQKTEEGQIRRTQPGVMGQSDNFRIIALLQVPEAKLGSSLCAVGVLARVIDGKFVPVSCCVEPGMGNCYM